MSAVIFVCGSVMLCVQYSEMICTIDNVFF
jgi:hypothetical protein